jgi:hypothetical protein
LAGLAVATLHNFYIKPCFLDLLAAWRFADRFDRRDGLAGALATGKMQDRMARPLRCTVQAPHSATPQPNFVPVSPTTSRSTHNKGMSSGTST